MNSLDGSAREPSRNRVEIASASAPGKVILLGEHAVVYGRPAIAVPVWQVRATATIRRVEAGVGCHINAAQIGRQLALRTAPADDPLALVVRLTLAHCHLPADPDWQVEVSSQIPIASGLGSGAGVSAALILAIHRQAGLSASPAEVSRLIYNAEKIYHGTPSGIDNTVIAYGRPVWFVHGEAPSVLTIGAGFVLAIADSGIPAPTKETVRTVRRAWQQRTEHYEALFDAIGTVVGAARRALQAGEWRSLGLLFDRNQALLAQLGVSSPALDALIDVARAAGALGAKLSGGGRGGNVIALVDSETAEKVRRALLAAGAQQVIVTRVEA